MFLFKVPIWVRKVFSGMIWAHYTDDILLTFDDGPHPETTPWILHYLKSQNLKAIFFVLGKNAERYPDLLTEIQREGHIIGNHGYDHLKGWRISTSDFLKNVERGFDVTGSTLFRPPYGQIGWSQYQSIKAKYDVMMWSVMPGDFITTINTDQVLAKVNKSLMAGDIIVLHDNPDHFHNMKSILKGLNI